VKPRGTTAGGLHVKKTCVQKKRKLKKVIGKKQSQRRIRKSDSAKKARRRGGLSCRYIKEQSVTGLREKRSEGIKDETKTI